MTNEGYPAILATLARIYDISAQYMEFTDDAWDGLPRTYEEYVARLYGQRPRDWMLILNYGLLGSTIALIIAIVAGSH